MAACYTAARLSVLKPELRLLPAQDFCPTTLRLRGHRDELIAVEQELGRPLNLHSDGKLLSSPI